MDPNSALPRDANHAVVMGGIDTTDPTKVLPIEINPATGGVIVDATLDTTGLATDAKLDDIIDLLEPSTGIGHGVRTVATAGTDVALSASSVPCRKVTIQAQTDNTGLIAVGGSGVDATEATGTGVLLTAGDAVTLEIANLDDVYIDATVNGDGVRYTYLT